MTVTPDFAGFEDAQRRLRAALARTVIVHSTTPAVYPPGTPLDPESGEPHDPTIAPESGGEDVSQVINARVHGAAFMGAGAAAFGGREVTDQLGIHSTRDVALVVEPELYDDVKDARTFEVDDQTFAVQNVVHDEIAHAPRVIVYGKAA
jgi:hypothetical protein